MKLEELQQNWEAFGQADPLWGILAWPDKKGNRWEIESFFATGVQEIDDVLAAVSALGRVVPHGSALDFGCGVGRLSQALAMHFDTVHGVDISPTMIALAGQYNQFGERVQYHLNEAEHLQLFADASFDFIYSNITLQHMHPRYSRRYLVEFLRLLRPDGVLVFQLPGRPERRRQALVQPVKSTRLFRAYQRLRYGDAPIMEMYYIDRSDVESWLSQHGGRVLAAQPDASADKHWQSYRYIVARTAKGASEI